MKRLIGLLVPSEKIFFELLAKQSKFMLKSVKILCNSLKNNPIKSKHVKLVKKIENKADTARHETIFRLNQSFITPFDREDIHLLSEALDDVTDQVDELMSRFEIYDVKKPSKDLKKMSTILLETAKELNKAVIDLPKSDKELLKHCRKINELEHEGDLMFRKSLKKVFKEKSGSRILKEKELLEMIEGALDKCEDAAVIIESIIIKSS